MKSYLKFLSRNKLYTAIEAVGLIVSLAFVVIIGSSIRDQLGIVYNVPDHDNLYLVGPAAGHSIVGEYRVKEERKRGTCIHSGNPGNSRFYY